MFKLRPNNESIKLVFTKWLIFFISIVVLTFAEPGVVHLKPQAEDKVPGLPRVPPCPEEADIAPCVCYLADDNPDFMVMDCSAAENEEQLQNAFLADFPTREFRTFNMKYNKNVTQLGDVMQGTTFLVIGLGYSELEVITEDCFIASVNTLWQLAVSGSRLTTNNFPFSSIGSYSQLLELQVADSRLDTFPDLSSSTLTQLWLPNNEIVGVLPASAFINTPNLTDINLYYNAFSEVEPGTFSNLPFLKSVSLMGNLLSVVRAGTFTVSSDVLIGLASNSITAVQPGAFSRTISGVRLSINLSNNFLTEIEEYVWTDVLSDEAHLSLTYNPLLCGCDIAWLLFNRTFLGRVESFTQCQDGRLLHDLDPAEYAHC